jgi:hypothetical protein
VDFVPSLRRNVAVETVWLDLTRVPHHFPRPAFNVHQTNHQSLAVCGRWPPWRRGLAESWGEDSNRKGRHVPSNGSVGQKSTTEKKFVSKDSHCITHLP